MKWKGVAVLFADFAVSINSGVWSMAEIVSWNYEIDIGYIEAVLILVIIRQSCYLPQQQSTLKKNKKRERSRGVMLFNILMTNIGTVSKITARKVIGLDKLDCHLGI